MIKQIKQRWASKLSPTIQQMQQEYSQTHQERQDEISKLRDEYKRKEQELEQCKQQLQDATKQIQLLQYLQETHFQFQTFETLNRSSSYIANVKAFSNDKIKAIIDFLEFYKYDLLKSSLTIAHSNDGFQWRHGGISQIDALLVFFKKSMTNE